MNIVPRQIEAICRSDLATSPILTLTGPRQSGKSTLLKTILPKWRYVNLEDPSQLDFATDDPKGFLDMYSDQVVIDEVQRSPKLLSYIQVRVDEDRRPGRYALSGSNNLLLLQSISQSLAGRTSVRHLLPFSYQELAVHGRSYQSIEETLFFGGYPPVFNNTSEAISWIDSYTQTYIERDVRLIRNVTDLGQFRRFLKLCAGRAGQILDLSSLGRDAGVTHNTIRDWLSVLETGFIAFRLEPFHQNFSKRVIKSPKIFFYDTGILCRLLGISTPEDLSLSPYRGAIFENWCIVEALKSLYNKGGSSSIYFWKDKLIEVDLLIERSSRSIAAFECKSSKTPPPSSEALQGYRYLKNLMQGYELSGGAVYAGSEYQRRTEGEVFDWRGFAEKV